MAGTPRAKRREAQSPRGAGEPRVAEERTETQQERSDRIRTRAIEALPSWYSPWGHLLVTTGTGVVMLALGLIYIRGVRPLEWMVPPLVFVLANLFEWRAHKHILHRRRRFLEIIYDRHTPVHHMVFTENSMTIREPQELRLVLIPAAGIVGIVVGLAPLAALAGFLITPNTGWLMLVTAALYMVTYELSHTSYHLPEDSFIGRRWLIRVLRKHHARHHDPELMQGWNFNVTVPLFDWILGTIAPAHGEVATKRPDGALGDAPTKPASTKPGAGGEQGEDRLPSRA